MGQVLDLARKENAKSVASVSLWLGALSHMSTDHFQDHYAEVSAGTLAEGAKLNIEVSSDVSDPNAQSIILRSIEVSD